MRFQNIIHVAHRLGQLKHGVDHNSKYVVPYLTRWGKNNILPPLGTTCLTRNLSDIYRYNQQVSGSRINFGGDHSMSLATIAHSLQTHPDLRVVWFDAHADINTFQASSSKNYHGMPLAFLTGLDSHPDFSFVQRNLEFSNLLYVGLRDIDPFEQDILDRHHIQTISVDMFNQNLPHAWETLRQFVTHRHVHLSFDVDCLDPQVMPSTGTTSPGGLDTLPVKWVMEQLYALHCQSQTNLYNLEIAELNLALGTPTEQQQSWETVREIFHSYFQEHPSPFLVG